MLTTLRRHVRSLTGKQAGFSLALGIAMVGLLFWARLIVIADMPRTAVAVPDPPAATSVPLPDPDSRKNDVSDNDPSDIGTRDNDAEKAGADDTDRTHAPATHR